MLMWANQIASFSESLDRTSELPGNTTCLMDCETIDILKGKGELLVVVVSSSACFHLTQFRPLKQHDVSDGELCMIANFHLEFVDQVFALVPSFKTKQSKLRVPLENVLAELAKPRREA
ncbi:DNA-directed RNA polymerases IV and V subunit 4-like [Solanum tuberosum]|uniref:DNA-directed RNA polymerases IV and V subunit 4-like n=1 Tax=Solanum tuberosum TaxID=4113 RepID=UPI0003D27F52|nr:PREDICTED: DNA-directed RNA polymerases IV and V subunit 4-like [Solanum tuberosum]